MSSIAIRAFLLFIFLGFGEHLLVAAEPAKTVEPVPVADLPTVLKNIAEGKAVLVDVRTEQEYKEQSLRGAIPLPLAEIKKNAANPDGLQAYLANHLPKDKIIYVHCQAGVRAKQACTIGAGSGFDLRPLKADYDQLLEAGFAPK